MSSLDTFPRLLADHAARHPDQVALQEKRYGIWQTTTWRRYHERVRDLAHGLADLGVEPGAVVAVIGDNRPEWVIAELAAQSLGACIVGVYPTSVGDEVRHVLEDARVRVVVAEDQEQADKVIGLWDTVPTLQTLVVYDPRGLERYERPYLVQFCDVEARGREVERERLGWLDEQVAAGSEDDVAVICTTSGTTGRPKLAMLSHANLLSVSSRLIEIDPIDPDDRYVSFLPFAWLGEQMLTLACGMRVGFTTSFCEDAATVRADLREIGPDVLFSPPRIWEDMVSDVQVRLGEADALKRAVFTWAHRVGGRAADLRAQSRRVGPWLTALVKIADVVALRPVRDQLGLARLERGYTGGAPLGPDVFRFFHALGVNLKQIYGSTESGGVAVAHRDGDVRFHTVGVPTPGTELRIADDGEILLRSPGVFHGYYGNDEATATAIDADGWLHTGDAGYLDGDHLVVIDRAKDVIAAPDGTRFSPAFIQNKLKFSPFVEEAVIFGGDGRGRVVAILTIDAQTVGAWAERAHVGYTTYTDLAQKEQVYRLVAGEVDRANSDLPEAVRVHRFALLHKQLDPDDAEITRTRKVRRAVVSQRYAAIVDALFDDQDEVVITSVVAYQDGGRAEREIPVRLASMERFAPTATPPWARGMAGSAG